MTHGPDTLDAPARHADRTGLPLLLDQFQHLVEQSSIATLWPAAGECLEASGLPGAALAGVVSALSAQPAGKGEPLEPRVIVLVARTPLEADALRADIETIAGATVCVTLPQRESLPYEDEDPHVEISAQRANAVAALLTNRSRVIATTARGLVERSPVGPADDFALDLGPGMALDRDELADELERRGFQRTTSVGELGDFALRGTIVDVFPFGDPLPLRVELWDGRVRSLRRFDPLTQRSIGTLDQAEILPVDLAAGLFQEGTAKLDGGGHGAVERRCLLELIPDSALVIECGGGGLELRRQLWTETAEARADLDREDALPAAALVMPPNESNERLSSFGRIVVEDDASNPDLDFGVLEPPTIDRDMDRLITEVRSSHQTDEELLILCDNDGQLARLEEILEELGGRRLASSTHLALGSLQGGFRLGAPNGLLVLTDHEIFRRARRLRRTGRLGTAATIESLNSLAVGDYVVHMEHGIGRYRGLEKVEAGGESIETLKIEYADGEILRVPHYRLDLVERWTAVGETGVAAPPMLHKVGGKRWTALKQKTEASIRQMAAELTDLYAHRQVKPGFAFTQETRWQREMESAFLYEDTEDQRRAWEDTRADMERPAIMDRLVCGDVGYGKTEIAIRAAFKAVQDGKQVAVLAPTTVLAEQHSHTFAGRLADFPVRIEALSRLRSTGQQAQVLQGLKAGEVDIVIGTHRLLSTDVVFHDLGLLVIDEEQRFGVRHKERLKELKRSVDVLTLTATPIPRTLQLALSGLRDMSRIDTPPRDRMPVITHVLGWSDSVLRDAMRREMDRGGQIFFVHDRIESIQALAKRAQRLAPDARVSVAHGRMNERDLQRAMDALMSGGIDVLVSTSIIENGLDVPRANTMIVNRADRFGLAQLYQLRGRVGRSHHRAYCYLLVPPNVTPDAAQRLRILEHHTGLGSGYDVALKDLQLRGAGNLLGASQSGFAQAVGFETYQRLLRKAVARLKGEPSEDDQAPAQIWLEGDALLPDEYIEDSQQKMHLYRRLAGLVRAREVDDLEAELRDRFGSPPEAASALLDSTRLKLLSRKLEVDSIRISEGSARLNFRAGAIPRLARLSGALADRQIAVEVRRTEPLSLVLTNAGTEPLAPTLVLALDRLNIETES